MRVFEEIRGHFAVLVGKEFKTLAQGKTFRITRVEAERGSQANWIVGVMPKDGEREILVYVSDILRAYTSIISDHWGREASMDDLKRVA